MKHRFAITLFVPALMMLGLSCGKPTPVVTPPATSNPNVRNVNVTAGQTISFPFTLTGEARGTWYFEASFPVRIEDGNGAVVLAVPAQAQGDWMTENFVPFKVELNPTSPITTDEGTLVIVKDNPSGLPEHDASVRIPIRFAAHTMVVKAFFINTITDPNRLDCSRVDAVTRSVPQTTAVARAALEQLLAGPSAAEKASGFTTAINAGVTIKSLTITNGLAAVTFTKELQKNVGGSCLVTSIRAQIEQTLKQFSTVKTVQISVDGFKDEEILQP